MKEQPLLLVNEQDEPVGTMEKMEAHRKGVLHRAFSVFIFDAHGRMLLQQRAAQKYHGGGLWTNACCSHPHPGEAVHEAAQRRLQEELGFTTPLEKLFHFTYRAEVENGLVEHEFDHVYAGSYAGPVAPDPAEVAAYAFMEMSEVDRALEQSPEGFTTWFRIIFPRISQWWATHFGQGPQPHQQQA